jgi:hypothetical protein
MVSNMDPHKTYLRIPFDRIVVRDGKLIYMGTAEDFYQDAGVELVEAELDGDERAAYTAID